LEGICSCTNYTTVANFIQNLSSNLISRLTLIFDEILGDHQCGFLFDEIVGDHQCGFQHNRPAADQILDEKWEYFRTVH